MLTNDRAQPIQFKKIRKAPEETEGINKFITLQIKVIWPRKKRLTMAVDSVRYVLFNFYRRPKSLKIDEKIIVTLYWEPIPTLYNCPCRV